MPARLILNADDFGLTPGVNRAIGELNAAGVVTSATLMANGPAFEDAVSVARAHPTLGVGCHVVRIHLCSPSWWSSRCWGCPSRWRSARAPEGPRPWRSSSTRRRAG